jgi:hypothetical protein
MLTFRNTKFHNDKGNSCTKIAYCQAKSYRDAKTAAPHIEWQECPEHEIEESSAENLYTIIDVRMFGWL